MAPWLFLLLFALGSAEAFGADIQLCPRFHFRAPERLKFTEAETRLLCGDPTSPAWSVVPPAQAEFLFRSFLQDRGYYRPTFTRTEDSVRADAGEPTNVRALLVQGEPAALPESLRADRLRGVLGERLTPKFLDELQKRTELRLGIGGFPCAKITTAADPKTGEIVLTVVPGPHSPLMRIERTEIPGVQPDALQRYDAFHVGDYYNSDATAVTSSRLIADGVVQSAHHSGLCSDEGTVVEQRLLAGPPRRFSVGVGANTERLVQFRTKWQHARLGASASILKIFLQGSWTDQTLGSDFRWFLLPSRPRFFLRNTTTVRRDRAPRQEFYTVKTASTAGTSRDVRGVHVEGELGPSGYFIRSVVGAAEKPNTAFGSLDFRIAATSLAYERYVQSPRGGWNTELRGSLVEEDVLSDTSIRFLRWSGEWLWNLDSFDPPLFVLGLRTYAAVTSTPRPLAPQTASLEPFRQFLGGRADLRGFSYRELPGDSFGALTAAAASLELRWRPSPNLPLEPLIFADIGAVGRGSFQLEAPVYYSPGAGMRWESPIGTLRSTLAHGYTLGPIHRTRANISHWQFYFSLGEEF